MEDEEHGVENGGKLGSGLGFWNLSEERENES